VNLTWIKKRHIALPIIFLGYLANLWLYVFLDSALEKSRDQHIREFRNKAELSAEKIQARLHHAYDALTIIATSEILRQNPSLNQIEEEDSRSIIHERQQLLTTELGARKLLYTSVEQLTAPNQTPFSLPIEEIIMGESIKKLSSKNEAKAPLSKNIPAEALREASAWVLHNHPVLLNRTDVQYPSFVKEIEIINKRNQVIENFLLFAVPVYSIEKRMEGLVSALIPLTFLAENLADDDIQIRSKLENPADAVLMKWTLLTSGTNENWWIVENSSNKRADLERESEIEVTFYLATAAIWIIAMGAITLIHSGIKAYNLQIERRRSAEKQVAEGEAELAQESNKFQAVLRNSLDAIILMDAGGVITGWEGASQSIFGWSKNEAIGKSLGNLIIPERFQEAHLAGLRRYLHTGETRVLNRRIEVMAKRRNLEEFPCELAITAVGENRKQCSFSATIRDITERKRSEDALVSTKIELEKTLQKAKLSEEQAIKANSVKGQFLANMSHEIRTPLNGIIGMTRAILETKLEEEQRELLDIVQASSETLLHLVNDVLDIPRIETGKLELTLKPFNLHNLIYNTARPYLSEAADKNIEMVVRIDHDFPNWIKSDEGRIKQILKNLIGNAVKFTPNLGGIVISASNQGPKDGSIQGVRITINDSGIGIPKEKLTSIFELFSPADNSTTKRYEGTGLGLPIASRLANALGGKIWANSMQNVGSSFHIDLPVEITEFMGSYLEDNNQIKTDTPRVNSELRIMVVEDNPVNQKVMIKLLEKYGYKTAVVANNGLEAVEKFEKYLWDDKFFDLILMDCQMPELDGYQATAAIRKLEERAGIPWEKGVPIMAVTANAMKGDKDRCLAAGMNGYTSKPVKPLELFSEFDRLLNRKNDTSEPRSSITIG
jgi:PAS domain S-box-containing protein